jgi:hypothetical protein
MGMSVFLFNVGVVGSHFVAAPVWHIRQFMQLANIWF